MRTLIEYQEQCPELTYQNKGYDTISREVQEKYRQEIKDIEAILKTVIEGFIEFNNFKLDKDGKIKIRCQYLWDKSFVGVGYFYMDEIMERLNKLNN